MDWLHIAVTASAGLAICILAYIYEMANDNDKKFRNRALKAAAVFTALLIVSGVGAGFWGTIDLLGLVGLLLITLAWLLRTDEDFRWISLIFAACFLGAWAYFTDTTSAQKYAGVGLALACCVMTELNIRTWVSGPDKQGDLVAVIN